MKKRKICQGKRCFKSAGAARRSANERGMVPCRVYRCPRCKLHHVTSSKALHADNDQDFRELDPLEKLQQEDLDRARVDRKVAQAVARQMPEGPGGWFADPDAGVPYVDLTDDTGALAYTPDDELGKPIVLSPEAFDEFSRELENPRPPTPELVELMRGRRCSRCAAPIGDRHQDDPLSHACPERTIPEPGPRSRGARLLRQAKGGK